MKFTGITAMSIFCMCLASCIGSAYDRNLNGGYYLSATDIRSDMSLGYADKGYGVGIVDATVFAIGQNDNYIILKRHPSSRGEIDKNIEEYYIIPLKNHCCPTKIRIRDVRDLKPL